MILSEVGGDAWKVEALVIATAATLMLFLTLLLRSRNALIARIAVEALVLLAVPLVAMIGFYLSGWQMAIGVLALGRLLARPLFESIVITRFPQQDVSRSPSRKISTFMFAVLGILIVAIDDRDLLRFLPCFMFITLLVDVLITERESDRSSLSGAARYLGKLVVAILVVLCSEMIWRYASFELWMWFYAWIHIFILLLVAIAVVPISMWVKAGEPGFRDP